MIELKFHLKILTSASCIKDLSHNLDLQRDQKRQYLSAELIASKSPNFLLSASSYVLSRKSSIQMASSLCFRSVIECYSNTFGVSQNITGMRSLRKTRFKNFWFSLPFYRSWNILNFFQWTLTSPLKIYICIQFITVSRLSTAMRHSWVTTGTKNRAFICNHKDVCSAPESYDCQKLQLQAALLAARLNREMNYASFNCNF